MGHRARVRALLAGGVLAGLAGLLAAAPAMAGAGAVPRIPAVVPGAGHAVPAAPPPAAACRKFLHAAYPKSGFTACYSPLQLQRAYDLRALYARGFNGRGRTIVVADPFGSPTIRHDLSVFDRAFGLSGPPSFRILQPAGPVPPYDPKNSVMVDKAGETTLDVEWSHAMAPGASILLIETPGTTATNIFAGGGYPQLMAAENYVIEHNLGDVISQSFSLPEQNFPAGTIQRLRYAFVNAVRHRVTVLAASNDYGVAGPSPAGAFYRHRVVWWPASDPLVTGVGGTKLYLDAAGDRISPDTAWNDTYATTTPSPLASNGGVSAIFGRPRYQYPVRGIAGDHRGVPDISMSAAVSAGVLTYGSFPGNTFPFHGWVAGGGTSEATPEMAGIVAIADQYAGHRLGLINPALYLRPGHDAPGIADVTRGSNTVTFSQGNQLFTLPGYQARPGYDLVTGVGTVDAARLVPELAGIG
jgi:subtilase family serine protease